MIRGTTLAVVVDMPHNPKDSQSREDEDERDDSIEPRVDESELGEDEEEERTPQKSDDIDEDADEEDDEAEEIDLDDLSAMEGPDA